MNGFAFFCAFEQHVFQTMCQAGVGAIVSAACSNNKAAVNQPCACNPFVGYAKTV
jgi:hypothetical protein